MKRLKEYMTGQDLGAASDEEAERFSRAVKSGNPYITRGYHGYTIKAVVVEEEKPRGT